MITERERALEAARRIVDARPIEREAVYLHEALTVARALLSVLAPAQVPKRFAGGPVMLDDDSCVDSYSRACVPAHPCEMRKALEKIANPVTRFDTTNSPNDWAEVLAIRKFARAALDAGRTEEKS